MSESKAASNKPVNLIPKTCQLSVLKDQNGPHAAVKNEIFQKEQNQLCHIDQNLPLQPYHYNQTLYEPGVSDSRDRFSEPPRIIPDTRNPPGQHTLAQTSQLTDLMNQNELHETGRIELCQIDQSHHYNQFLCEPDTFDLNDICSETPEIISNIIKRPEHNILVQACQLTDLTNQTELYQIDQNEINQKLSVRSYDFNHIPYNVLNSGDISEKPSELISGAREPLEQNVVVEACQMTDLTNQIKLHKTNQNLPIQPYHYKQTLYKPDVSGVTDTFAEPSEIISHTNKPPEHHILAQACELTHLTNQNELHKTNKIELCQINQNLPIQPYHYNQSLYKPDTFGLNDICSETPEISSDIIKPPEHFLIQSCQLKDLMDQNKSHVTDKLCQIDQSLIDQKLLVQENRILGQASQLPDLTDQNELHKTDNIELCHIDQSQITKNLPVHPFNYNPIPYKADTIDISSVSNTSEEPFELIASARKSPEQDIVVKALKISGLMDHDSFLKEQNEVCLTDECVRSQIYQNEPVSPFEPILSSSDTATKTSEIIPDANKPSPEDQGCSFKPYKFCQGFRIILESNMAEPKVTSAKPHDILTQACPLSYLTDQNKSLHLEENQPCQTDPSTIDQNLVLPPFSPISDLGETCAEESETVEASETISHVNRLSAENQSQLSVPDTELFSVNLHEIDQNPVILYEKLPAPVSSEKALEDVSEAESISDVSEVTEDTEYSGPEEDVISHAVGNISIRRTESDVSERTEEDENMTVEEIMEQKKSTIIQDAFRETVLNDSSEESNIDDSEIIEERPSSLGVEEILSQAAENVSTAKSDINISKRTPARISCIPNDILSQAVESVSIVESHIGIAEITEARPSSSLEHFIYKKFGCVKTGEEGAGTAEITDIKQLPLVFQEIANENAEIVYGEKSQMNTFKITEAKPFPLSQKQIIAPSYEDISEDSVIDDLEIIETKFVTPIKKIITPSFEDISEDSDESEIIETKFVTPMKKVFSGAVENVSSYESNTDTNSGITDGRSSSSLSDPDEFPMEKGEIANREELLMDTSETEARVFPLYRKQILSPPIQEISSDETVMETTETKSSLSTTEKFIYEKFGCVKTEEEGAGTAEITDVKELSLVFQEIVNENAEIVYGEKSQMDTFKITEAKPFPLSQKQIIAPSYEDISEDSVIDDLEIIETKFVTPIKKIFSEVVENVSSYESDTDNSGITDGRSSSHSDEVINMSIYESDTDNSEITDERLPSPLDEGFSEESDAGNSETAEERFSPSHLDEVKDTAGLQDFKIKKCTVLLERLVMEDFSDSERIDLQKFPFKSSSQRNKVKSKEDMKSASLQDFKIKKCTVLLERLVMEKNSSDSDKTDQQKIPFKNKRARNKRKSKKINSKTVENANTNELKIDNSKPTKDVEPFPHREITSQTVENENKKNIVMEISKTAADLPAFILEEAIESETIQNANTKELKIDISKATKDVQPFPLRETMKNANTEEIDADVSKTMDNLKSVVHREETTKNANTGKIDADVLKTMEYVKSVLHREGTTKNANTGKIDADVLKTMEYVKSVLHREGTTKNVNTGEIDADVLKTMEYVKSVLHREGTTKNANTGEIDADVLKTMECVKSVLHRGGTMKKTNTEEIHGDVLKTIEYLKSILHREETMKMVNKEEMKADVLETMGDLLSILVGEVIIPHTGENENTKESEIDIANATETVVPSLQIKEITSQTVENVITKETEIDISKATEVLQSFTHKEINDYVNEDCDILEVTGTRSSLLSKEQVNEYVNNEDLQSDVVAEASVHPSLHKKTTDYVSEVELQSNIFTEAVLPPSLCKEINEFVNDDDLLDRLRSDIVVETTLHPSLHEETFSETIEYMNIEESQNDIIDQAEMQSSLPKEFFNQTTENIDISTLEMDTSEAPKTSSYLLEEQTETEDEDEDKEEIIEFDSELFAMVETFGNTSVQKPKVVKYLHHLLQIQMDHLIKECENVMRLRGAKNISHEDVLFLMRKNKVLLKRLLHFLYLQDCGEFQIPGFSDYEGTECLPKEGIKGTKVLLCRQFLKSIEKAPGDLYKLFNCKNISDSIQEDQLLKRLLILNNHNVKEIDDFDLLLSKSFCHSKPPGLFKKWLKQFTSYDITPVALAIIDFLAIETIARLTDKALCLKPISYKEEDSTWTPYFNFSNSVKLNHIFKKNCPKSDKCSSVSEKYLKNNKQSVLSEKNLLRSWELRLQKLLLEEDSEMKLAEKVPLSKEDFRNAFMNYQFSNSRTDLIKSKQSNLSRKRKHNLVCLVSEGEEYEEKRFFKFRKIC